MGKFYQNIQITDQANREKSSRKQMAKHFHLHRILLKSVSVHSVKQKTLAWAGDKCQEAGCLPGEHPLTSKMAPWMHSGLKGWNVSTCHKCLWTTAWTPHMGRILKGLKPAQVAPSPNTATLGTHSDLSMPRQRRLGQQNAWVNAHLNIDRDLR